MNMETDHILDAVETDINFPQMIEVIMPTNAAMVGSVAIAFASIW